MQIIFVIFHFALRKLELFQMHHARLEKYDVEKLEKEFCEKCSSQLNTQTDPSLYIFTVS